MRVSIEGVLGAGKSSVLRRLKDDGYKVVREAAENHFDLLKMFHDDPSRWGFLLQTRILCGYADTPGGDEKATVIVERSPLSSLEMFAGDQRAQGLLSALEWAGLHDLHSCVGWAPDAMVYLHIPPETSLARTRLRGRECERGVDLDYLRRLVAAGSQMVHRYQGPVCEVDATQSEDQVYDVVTRWLRESGLHV